MSKQTIAPTWAEINLDNIKFNLNNIKKILNEDTKICGVVKANAYGHGAVEVAKLLQREKVDYLAVARLEEGIELRQNDIKLPILCLGYIPEECIDFALKNKIYMTVYSLDMAKKINEIAKSMDIQANIHIKIDTGMSRIGFKPDEISISEIESISKMRYIRIEGIYTHFAKADEEDKEYTYLQAKRYNYIVNELDKRNVNIPIKHTSNSAAIMELLDLEFNMVRCGIILYGHYPSDEVNKKNIELKPSMKLKSRIAYLKEVDSGVGISYGWKYKTNGKEKIATIPIGYADGFTRIQRNPKVYIKNIAFDVVGRICMDQCMVKIDKDIDIKIGDEVIIFGEGDATVEAIAKDIDTINYEILCMISRRIERVYMERNAILHSTSYLVK
ncbi:MULTISPECIES: alanine racemase [unclassified Romboutsia]|uniref:alanine racemase n=1 Tax=unclassified Romboutsia TaxID=2626894 RepID=UPI000822E594|nr:MULTISPECIES: alanine racemase [unclassified Romboutsia]SCI36740.1 Alanine racemase [uncultured Clostridium sp.]